MQNASVATENAQARIEDLVARMTGSGKKAAKKADLFKKVRENVRRTIVMIGTDGKARGKFKKQVFALKPQMQYDGEPSEGALYFAKLKVKHHKDGHKVYAVLIEAHLESNPTDQFLANLRDYFALTSLDWIQSLPNVEFGMSMFGFAWSVGVQTIASYEVEQDPDTNLDEETLESVFGLTMANFEEEDVQEEESTLSLESIVSSTKGLSMEEALKLLADRTLLEGLAVGMLQDTKGVVTEEVAQSLLELLDDDHSEVFTLAWIFTFKSAFEKVSGAACQITNDSIVGLMAARELENDNVTLSDAAELGSTIAQMQDDPIDDKIKKVRSQTVQDILRDFRVSDSDEIGVRVITKDRIVLFFKGKSAIIEEAESLVSHIVTLILMEKGVEIDHEPTDEDEVEAASSTLQAIQEATPSSIFGVDDEADENPLEGFSLKIPFRLRSIVQAIAEKGSFEGHVVRKGGILYLLRETKDFTTRIMVYRHQEWVLRQVIRHIDGVDQPTQGAPQSFNQAVRGRFIPTSSMTLDNMIAGMIEAAPQFIPEEVVDPNHYSHSSLLTVVAYTSREAKAAMSNVASATKEHPDPLPVMTPDPMAQFAMALGIKTQSALRAFETRLNNGWIPHQLKTKTGEIEVRYGSTLSTVSWDKPLNTEVHHANSIHPAVAKILKELGITPKNSVLTNRDGKLMVVRSAPVRDIEPWWVSHNIRVDQELRAETRRRRRLEAARAANRMKEKVERREEARQQRALKMDDHEETKLTPPDDGGLTELEEELAALEPAVSVGDKAAFRIELDRYAADADTGNSHQWAAAQQEHDPTLYEEWESRYNDLDEDKIEVHESGRYKGHPVQFPTWWRNRYLEAKASGS